MLSYPPHVRKVLLIPPSLLREFLAENGEEPEGLGRVGKGRGGGWSTFSSKKFHHI
jgi:hypothetical protein